MLLVLVTVTRLHEIFSWPVALTAFCLGIFFWAFVDSAFQQHHGFEVKVDDPLNLPGRKKPQSPS